ncbi:MAG TPA: serine hydrolase [Candidatus Paceibacterota bacterium]|nr:serine hydrolase [Candidatus Paceibacterota bacterium]
METSELQAIAERSRSMREAGIALLLASVVLGAFLFIPLAPTHPAQEVAAAAVAASSTDPAAFADVPIEAKAAIVYDLASGKVLFDKNAEAQLPLASLTKLLTVYTGLTVLGPDAVVTIPEDAVGLGAPQSFSAGEEFTLSDLARITLTGSLNDGAQSIAEAAAAEEGESTAQSLGSEAAALGLSATYAVNGSGLDETTSISGGYGSAYDVARLAGDLAALAPQIAAATTQSSASARSLAGVVHTIQNTNPGVSRAPRLLLSKTGYTDLAGGNLALVFDAGIGHPIAVVVLGSSEDARFTDADALVAATLAYFAGTPSL